MRAAWRLCISNLSARPSRTALLVGVVALSAILIAAVGVSMGSVLASIKERASTLVGSADARIEGKGAATTIDARWLDTARAWPQVQSASGTLQGTLALRFGAPEWVPAATGDSPPSSPESWTDADAPFELTVRTHQVTSRAIALAPGVADIE
jgi:hypothetical protein